MQTETKTSMGFFGWLLLLFIGLKLTGYIAWSWWWVLAPLWMPSTVVLVMVVFALLMAKAGRLR